MDTNIIPSIVIDAGSNILPNTLAYGGNYSYPNPPVTGSHIVKVTISDSSNYSPMLAMQTRSAAVIASNYFTHTSDGTQDTAMSGISFVDGDIFSFRAANYFEFPDFYTINAGSLGGGCTISSGTLVRSQDANNDAAAANKTVTVNIEFTSDTGAVGKAQVVLAYNDTSGTIPAVSMTGGGGGTCTTFTSVIKSIIVS